LQASTQNGAIVLIDVTTGEILVLASWPSYDLNLWVPKVEIEEYQKRSADPAKPLFPRATFAQYPTGGPFKLVTALAGLAAGHGNAVFFCEEKLKIGDRYFHNHSKKDVGDFDLERAIARSHNVYFYQLALQLGHQPLAAMAEKLGFGEKTGLPLEAEGAGHFPAFPLTGRRQGSTLSDGEIANLSIGQGTVLATTVQMAQMAATIASRGKAPGPVLVKGDIGKPATELKLREKDWDLLHRAMRCDVPRAVTGSGASAHVNIAMMAGTSQWNVRQKQNLAQVVGFAPMENPQVAFAVVLEGRPEQSMSGGGMAAPMAKRIVERYFGHSVEPDSKLEASNNVRSSSSDEEDLRPQSIQKPEMDEDHPRLLVELDCS
jgi:penicillin-binding protein 2